MSRWPTIVAVLALLGALVVAERFGESEPAEAEPVEAPALLSQFTGAEGSTWYCPAGLSTPDGASDHIVVLNNVGDRAASGTITLFPSLLDTSGESVPFERATSSVLVPATSATQVSIASLLANLGPDLNSNTGAFSGALVEFESPSVLASHRIVSPIGSDSGPCATTASDEWWFSSGTTTADVRYLLFVLNPFADDAVIDVSFITDEGARSPNAFKSRLVPARTMAALDVSSVVSVWDQITTSVTARSGRVIAERVQVFGSEDGPFGMSMALGMPALNEQWFFAAGRSVPGAGESYVVLNPGDEPAEIELEARPDSLAEGIAPVAITLGPRERWVINLADHATHPSKILASSDATGLLPADRRFFVTVRSFNGVPVAVERVITVPAALGSGVAAGAGASTVSTRQVIALPYDDSGQRSLAGTVAVLNPADDTVARVILRASVDGAVQVLAETEIAPRRRAVWSLGSLGAGAGAWIEVESSVGVTAEAVVTNAPGLMAVPAVPQAGTISVPELLSFD